MPNIERLQQVVRVLEDLPKGRKFSLRFFAVGDAAHLCKTTACACGWAASDPWFKRRGFRLYKGVCGDEYGIETRSGERDWTAIESFFGLTPNQAENLFSEWRYVRGSRRDVIRRLKKFIRDNSQTTAAGR